MKLNTDVKFVFWQTNYRL